MPHHTQRKPVAGNQSRDGERCVRDHKTGLNASEPITRRQAIASGLKGMAAAATSQLPAVALGSVAAAGASQSAQSKIPFGAAVNPFRLRDDQRYGPAIAKYCDLIVPSNGMKWQDIQNKKGVFDFRIADELFAFARENKLDVRGHTLVWDDCRKMPDWTSNAINGEVEAERELVGHIVQVMTRYKNDVRSWDVVNEPLRKPCDHSKTIWARRLGRRYIEIAFKTAHEIDPTAQLVLNENEIEFRSKQHRDKRKQLVDLVLQLLDKDIPIKSVGIQAHLSGHLAIDIDGLAEFSERLRREKLKVLVTELDVNDYAVNGNETTRDHVVAEKTRQLLQAIAKPDAIVTWGITDEHSWLRRRKEQQRKDGKALRPLPLDETYGEKAMMKVIQEFRKAKP